MNMGVARFWPCNRAARNVSLDDNSGDEGGGVYVSGAAATVTRCRIRRNQATTNGGGLAAEFGSTLTAADLELSDNRAYSTSRGGGGIYADHAAFMSASPALDAGNNATCEPVDQRNFARPYGPRCDIGAYEGP